MTKFARISDGVVMELFSLPPSKKMADLFHPSMVWIDCTATPGVAEGWRHDSSGFHPPDEAGPPPVPRSISRKQFILALLGAGLIPANDALAWAQSNVIPPAFDPVLGELTEEQAIAARITLMTMAVAERDSPLIAAVIGAELATAEQVDAVFRAGALI